MAEMSPAGTAMSRAMINDNPASEMVLGKASETIRFTETRLP
jgi:hypothetical protein